MIVRRKSGQIMTPESIWGYELLSSAYDEEPTESWQRIFEHTKEYWPADDAPSLN